jgi:hypothetical protein
LLYGSTPILVDMVLISVIGATLVEKYSKLISDGHAEKCPWRKAGCDGEWSFLPCS